MKLQILTQSVGRSGKTIVVKKTIVADVVYVGRASGNELHLPDPRVGLDEGFISNARGLMFVQANDKADETVHSVRSVRLRPGEVVEVGPYNLRALPPLAGFDGCLQVELRVPLEGKTGDFTERVGATSLRELPISKRWAAISMFALVALAAFLIPAIKPLMWTSANAVTQAPGVNLVSNKLTDRLWNPGPVMQAHQGIEHKCEACHQEAFVRVKDEACLTCHKMIGNHVGSQFHTSNMFEGARCASCHTDHKGRKPLQKDNDQFCIDCHLSIQAAAPGTKTLPVGDFAKNHPPFRLTLPDISAQPGPDGKVAKQRVRMLPVGSTDQKAAPKEVSNLIFPHDIHVSDKGIRSPSKGRVVMQCADCHQSDVSKKTFEPIKMEKHCQSCHQLEFEPAVTDRQVPHAMPREAKRVIDEFYAYLALNGTRDSFSKAFGVDSVGLLRRAGNPEPQRAQVLAMAQKKAEKVSAELFEVRTCTTCHAVTREQKADGVDWKVVQVAPNAAQTGSLHVWMPQSRFDHKSHAQAPCADCHDVKKSKSSADVAMPAIESCRTCHAGKHAEENKITSNCLLCHGFHVTGDAWGMQGDPKQHQNKKPVPNVQPLKTAEQGVAR
jgi:predicted CXXCH cytochrome family protein